MTRVPSDHPEKLEPLAAAERLVTAVGRHVLSAAQASLKTLRELLAKLPAADGDPEHGGDAPATPPPAAHAATETRTQPSRTPRTAPPSAEILRSAEALPASYGSDRLVLLARDPHCLYAYWDLSEARVHAVRSDARSELLRMVVRTYDVTQIAFDAGPPARFQDFAVSGDARSLYAYIGRPASCFVAEVGYLRSDGAFFPLARSLPIWTPRTDQPGAAPGRWMTVGWRERRDSGLVVPLATSGPDALEAGTDRAATDARAGTRQAPSSWSGPGAAQRGSWSLVRGGLATPDAPPLSRSND